MFQSNEDKNFLFTTEKKYIYMSNVSAYPILVLFVLLYFNEKKNFSLSLFMIKTHSRKKKHLNRPNQAFILSQCEHIH